jgi:hypothetical protein
MGLRVQTGRTDGVLRLVKKGQARALKLALIQLGRGRTHSLDPSWSWGSEGCGNETALPVPGRYAPESPARIWRDESAGGHLAPGTLGSILKQAGLPRK